MPNDIEKRALEMLLAGTGPDLSTLRDQLIAATVANRELSGAGFFTRLSVPGELPRAKTHTTLVLNDVHADIAGLDHGAGFVLYVTDGAIDVLECFIVDDRWPDHPVMTRAYYVHPVTPSSSSLVETKERDIDYAFRFV